MMRRLILLVACLMLSVTHTLAGDYADRMVIGFSADGAYFAFEEYGVQDGSGFPYSAIFLIDTESDSWVAGTPFRRIIQNDAATLQDVRGQTYNEAAATLSDLGIEFPGRHLINNAITELTDGHNVQFLLRALSPLPPTGWTLTVEEIPLSADCPDFGFPYVGYAIILTDPAGNDRQLHRDARIPQSRACPLGYAVSDVFAFDRGQDTVLLVLLSVFRLGFEGPDRRFLALAAVVTE